MGTTNRNLANQLVAIGIRPEYRQHMQRKLDRLHHDVRGQRTNDPRDLLTLRIVRLLQHHLQEIEDAIDVLEANTSALSASASEHQTLARQIARVLNSHGWPGTHQQEAHTLLLAMRYLFEHGRTGQIRWRKMADMVLKLDFSRISSSIAGAFVEAQLDRGTEPLAQSDMSGDLAPTDSVGQLFTSIGLTPLEWQIAADHLGPGAPRTLAKIADGNDLTSARVRTIERGAIDRLIQYAQEIRPIFEAIESDLAQLSESPYGRPMERVAERIAGALRKNGHGDVSGPSIHRIILAVRMCNHGRYGAMIWPTLSLAVACLEPVQHGHPAVAAHVRLVSHERDLEHRRLGTNAVICQVLQQIGGPMHRCKIYRSAMLAFGHLRPELTQGAVFAALAHHPELFDRTGPGTYTRKHFDQRSDQAREDVIASVLAERAAPATIVDIYEETRELLALDRNEVAVLLDLHPRFYQNTDGRYGLRAWITGDMQQMQWVPSLFTESERSRQRLNYAGTFMSSMTRDAPLPLRVI